MLSTTCLLAALLLSANGTTGTIVQSGSVSGGAMPMIQDVVVRQFDDRGGALELQSVLLEVQTSVIGGGTSTGMGPPDTTVFARLDGDFYLLGRLLVDTQAIISAVINNSGPQVANTFFDTDSGQNLLQRPAALEPWLGSGVVALQVFTQFQIDEDPPDTVFFGAGGGIQWTLTYVYTTP
jgi:hypothetical protein